MPLAQDLAAIVQHLLHERQGTGKFLPIRIQTGQSAHCEQRQRVMLSLRARSA